MAWWEELRAWKRRLLCGTVLLGLAVEGTYAQLPSTVAAQKAVYLRNVVSFVRWPDEAAGNGSGAFQFCVDGDAFLGFALSRELKTASLREQKVVVRLVKKKSDLRGCEAVIFARVDQRRVENALQEMEGNDVLTVGETEGFLKAGGVIQLSHQENGWGFEVNLDAARKARLKLDARLLQMAKSVVKNGGSLAD